MVVFVYEPMLFNNWDTKEEMRNIYLGYLTVTNTWMSATMKTVLLIKKNFSRPKPKLIQTSYKR